MQSKASFSTAEANMRFDDDLLTACLEGTYPYFFRVYQWQSPALTQAKNRDIPDALAELDSAFRSSGGGLVFHCPGDVVFSAALALKKGNSIKPLKGLLSAISTAVCDSLNDLSIPAVMAESADSSSKNIQFCTAYYSPYEVFVNGHKVLGVAAKRLKGHVFIQGLVYVNNSADFFPYPEFSSYFSAGCAKPAISSVLQEKLFTRLSNLLADLS